MTVATQTVYNKIEMPRGYTDFSFNVTLQGIAYNIRLQWNERGNYYAMTLKDADGTVRIAGRKVVADWPLLSSIPQARPAWGILMAISDDGAIDAPYAANVFDVGDLRLTFETLERADDA